ncbi:MAG: polyprenyl synthetase family protein [Phycisphaerales bacterium]|nr:polyprenyl synthetase family protein [Phycisphaerales bacterium]
MRGVLEIPENLLPLQAALAQGLARVQSRFDSHLESDLPPVARLCRHVERYRGKMLRPSLTLLCGLAAGGRSTDFDAAMTEVHVSVAAVCEMVHMATLVHDDVLDEADTRRSGQTVNRLHGNETAVMLGDLLIASAFRLCATIDAPTALAVGRASVELCEGELLQLHHRDSWSIDEPTYFEIINRKTAALIAVACELGAVHAGADQQLAASLASFGRRLGVAFQIQDDLLDLLGERSILGKPVHKDLEKGKPTLPVIHHLATASSRERSRMLDLLDHAAIEMTHDDADRIAEALRSTGSIEHARHTAKSLVSKAIEELSRIPESPARDLLRVMADAVVSRSR